jgi:copper chaperone NosL
MTAPGWTRRETVLMLSTSVVGLVLAALGACGGPKPATPPPIAYGEDLCDWCRMTVDDPRLAAAFVPVSGRALRFGEAGCLLSWLVEHRAVEGTPFVATRESGAWLPAPMARYARGVVRTPMGFNLAAWRGEPDADAESLSWARLLEEGAPRAIPG